MNEPIKHSIRERFTVLIFDNKQSGSAYLSTIICELINQNNQWDKHTCLGLATGSSPILFYAALVKEYKSQNVSFENVYSFNLDEYYPIQNNSPESYHHFMNEHLFDHVDMPSDNIYIPDGELPSDKVEEGCQKFENRIKALGGLDVQILGIGRNGHIGFNEPGSSIETTTRLVEIHETTRRDAGGAFGNLENVPHQALTMGVQTILSAKSIFLMAWGSGKAEIIKKAIEDNITPEVPASYLKNHNNVTYLLDQAAAAELNI